MKKLFGATSVAVLLATVPALAQDIGGAAVVQSAAPGDLVLANDLIGTEVFDSAGESLGEIQNLVIALTPRPLTPEPGAIVNPDAVGGGEPMAAAPEPESEMQVGAADAEAPELPAGTTGDSTEAAPAETSQPGAGETATAVTGSDMGAESAEAEADIAATPEPEIGAPETETAAAPETETPASSDAGTVSDPASGVTTLTPTPMQSRYEVVAAVVGVGGFLGIGQKNVAVPMDRIEFAANADGNRQILLNVTRNQLETAPEFESGQIE